MSTNRSDTKTNKLLGYTLFGSISLSTLLGSRYLVLFGLTIMELFSSSDTHTSDTAFEDNLIILSLTV